jgi:peptide deformylase
MAPLLILSTPCEDCLLPDEEFIKGMFEFMREQKGIGLAAPQIGIQSRFFVMDGDRDRFVFDPQVFEQAERQLPQMEGCLSIPGVQVPVVRPDWVDVRYFDGTRYVKERLHHIDARVFLHELDHLNGILFVERFAQIWTQYQDG